MGLQSLTHPVSWQHRPVTSTLSNAEPSGKTQDVSSGSASEAPAAAAALDSRDLQKSDIDALIGRDYIGLRLTIFRRTGDMQVAADLLNDAICTTWEKYRNGQIARPEQIAGYVFQVAMNLLRNHRRSVAERPERRADAKAIDAIAADDEVDDLDIGGNVLDKVIRIIRSMDSARDRTVLVRFYLDEDDKETICRDLRLTPAQFTKVLHRARQRLKELLESHGLKGSDVFSWLLI
jgi:RNA polymerase sigma-70 factor (ECF subfamily)